VIKVTKTFLPPLEEYTHYLREIWDREWVTNNGTCLVELEEKLAHRLKVKHVIIVNNGTIAIQIAIKALGLTGEIITTPFSYVATTSTIVWENCNPVFADIDRDTLCIDPNKVEQLITEKTTAILGTHVYGYPCAVERLQSLANQYNLKIIYDAAHAFGVDINGQSILECGDISTLSFHATKVFHTIEGGAMVTNNDLLADRLRYMRNFGHNGEELFWGLGINGKVSEVHAAMGLVNLKHIDQIIHLRKCIVEEYDKYLEGCNLKRPHQPPLLAYNYSYYPVVFDSEQLLLSVKQSLNDAGIFPRRYFYPSLNRLPYVGDYKVPIAEDISKRVLCLPLFVGLTESDISKICDIIKQKVLR
jgi:dTDP-4-amino-4,6-dideoxygalactose transaminase